MIARLHYSYTYRWDRADAAPAKLSGIMARLQVIF